MTSRELMTKILSTSNVRMLCMRTENGSMVALGEKTIKHQLRKICPEPIRLMYVAAKHSRPKIGRNDKAPRSWPKFFTHVKSLGFLPETIIDIGVYSGTPALYAAFPKATLYLFEPSSRCEPALKRILKRRAGNYWLAAAGREEGVSLFWERGNSANSLSDFGLKTGKPVTVPVVRVDKAINGSADAPIVIKLDCEGFELDALHGCAALLDRTELIITEARFHKYRPEMADFREVVTTFGSYGFVLYDLLDGFYHPHENYLDYIDLVFVKANGFIQSKLLKRPS